MRASVRQPLVVESEGLRMLLLEDVTRRLERPLPAHSDLIVGGGHTCHVSPKGGTSHQER